MSRSRSEIHSSFIKWYNANNYQQNKNPSFEKSKEGFFVLAVLFIDEVASIGFLLDDASVSEGIGIFSHRDHTILGTRLDRVGYLYQISLDYQVADSG